MAERVNRALILGRGADIWDEIEQAKRDLGLFNTIIAVKRMGRDYDGPVHHWVSFHPQFFVPWAKERAKHNRPPVGHCWSGMSQHAKRKPDYGIPILWLHTIGGSSGMLAVQAMLAMGEPPFEQFPKIHKAVLCGMPMTKSARYDDGKVWEEANCYWKPWEHMKENMGGEMEHRIRSMSGRTRELLGAPTKEWINDIS